MNGHWNGGRGTTASDVEAVAGELARLHPVDPGRIYLAGCRTAG
ncbi:MAG: hypothetical protein U9R74_16065 [Pseudomonadota bacterium]|nr:hypothetical protein [Pseudomonadota bacterium]